MHEQDPAALLGSVRGAILRAAEPSHAMTRAWLPVTGRVWVLSLGKAALAMALGAARLVTSDGGEVAAGLVLCPGPLLETDGAFDLPAKGFELIGCDHPWPTEKNLAAARRVASWIGHLPREGVLVACLSGGGSAYLTLPREGVTLQETVSLTKSLQRSGADIRELNCTRKHVEQLKGGRLAEMFAGRVMAYVLSDVLGDPLDAIASGPFHPDPTTYADALASLKARGVQGVAPAITRLLMRGAARREPETPKTWAALGAAGRITHTVISNNDGAVDAACAALAGASVTVVQTRRRVEGEASDVGIALAHEMCRAPDTGEHQAWVIGGEWVVDSRGTAGVGGPSQELALAWAAHSAGFSGTYLMAFSTDGIDGPTDAAGAIVSGETALRLARAGVHAEAALSNHDSYTALAKAGALIRTGSTGTNINHVAVGLKLSASAPLRMHLGVQG